ncbi:MAG: hypothetical protein K0S76_2406 [Herbinix sp.]|jgi:hypothetical protein|nr:hypothetical protein [Herbinix sp.]
MSKKLASMFGLILCIFLLILFMFSMAFLSAAEPDNTVAFKQRELIINTDLEKLQENDS